MFALLTRSAVVGKGSPVANQSTTSDLQRSISRERYGKAPEPVSKMGRPQTTKSITQKRPGLSPETGCSHCFSATLSATRAAEMGLRGTHKLQATHAALSSESQSEPGITNTMASLFVGGEGLLKQDLSVMQPWCPGAHEVDQSGPNSEIPASFCLLSDGIKGVLHCGGLRRMTFYLPRLARC